MGEPTKRTGWLLVPFAILMALIFVAPGQAQATRVFQNDQLDFGFSGKCLATTDDGIACAVKHSHRWVNLTRDGETEVKPTDDNTIDPDNGVMIFRGDYAWRKKGVTCKVFGRKIGKAGVRCTNGRRGFRLQRGKGLKKF